MKEHLVWWLLGFIPGGFVGGILAERFFFGKEYRKRIRDLQEDNAELERRLHEKREKDISVRETKANKEEKRIEDRLKAEKMTLDLGYKPKREEEGEIEEIDDEFDFEMDDIEALAEEDVRLISREDFDQEISQRDSESLTYYQQDGLLVDEVNDIISNQTDILGMAAIEIIDTTDEDILYLSNDAENKVYEIMVEHNQSFFRDVLGEY